MQQATFEVSVPKSILNYNLSSIDIQHYLNEWAVLHLFTDGQVSSGKAAQLLGITRLQFLELLRRRRISYLDYTPEELEEEFATVKQFQTSAKKQHLAPHTRATTEQWAIAKQHAQEMDEGNYVTQEQ